MEKINLEEGLKDYLERMSLPVEEMHPIQLQETKRAFMGGCAKMLEIMTNIIPDLDEKEAMDMISDMFGQVTEFFNNEVAKDEEDGI